MTVRYYKDFCGVTAKITEHNDGSVKHKEVKRSTKGLFIRINKAVLYEEDLPLGEEVEI